MEGNNLNIYPKKAMFNQQGTDMVIQRAGLITPRHHKRDDRKGRSRAYLGNLRLPEKCSVLGIDKDHCFRVKEGVNDCILYKYPRNEHRDEEYSVGEIFGRQGI